MKSSRVSAAEYSPRIKAGGTACLCLISIAGNIAAAFLAAALHLPLFSDTIFTVAVTFYAGFVPGLIVAGLYNPVMTLVECAVYGTEMFYFDFLYAFCGMLIVLSTYFLSRNKKEFFFNRTVTFVAFIAILVILIRNIENRKSLTENRTFISEIIQTQEAERKRISQELHDTVSQNIKTLLIEQKRFLSGIHGTGDTVPNEDTSAVKQSAISQLEKIIKLERQNQKELRAIIRNLSIPLLSTVPFKTVINDLCEQFSEQSDIPCTFFVEQDVTFEHFTNEQKHHIVRIIQEALNNVRIHANAEETSVIIRKVGHSEKDVSVLTHHDKIRIMIFDDGTGFDTAAIHAAGRLHFGMSGMEMRAKLLGGTLIITSRPETGTEVRLEVPLEK